MKITLLTGKTFDIKRDLGFDIIVRTSPQAKKLSLRVDSKARMPALTIPKYCSKKKAVAFVKDNILWLERQLQKLPETKPFQDKDKISLFGQIYKIKHNPKTRSGVFIQDNIIYVSGDAEFLSRRVKDFIKTEAKKHFLSLSRRKAKRIDCQVNNVVIKDTRSRWGSCSTNNNINYNWRIALAPTEVIDYIVSHEVAHLEHQDHSRNFWNCVKKLCPKYLVGKNWLKTSSKELYIYE